MKKNNIITIIICALIVSVGIGAVYFISKPQKNNNDIKQSSVMIDTLASDDKADTITQNPLADRQIYFAGINDCVINEKSIILLENPVENEDIFISYKIYDSATDKLVYETDLIPSGQSIKWTPSENLNEGDYALNFTQVPYWRASENDEWQILTNGNNTVNVTFTK